MYQGGRRLSLQVADRLLRMHEAFPFLSNNAHSLARSFWHKSLSTIQLQSETLTGSPCRQDRPSEPTIESLRPICQISFGLWGQSFHFYQHPPSICIATVLVSFGRRNRVDIGRCGRHLEAPNKHRQFLTEHDPSPRGHRMLQRLPRAGRMPSPQHTLLMSKKSTSERQIQRWIVRGIMQIKAQDKTFRSTICPKCNMSPALERPSIVIVFLLDLLDWSLFIFSLKLLLSL